MFVHWQMNRFQGEKMTYGTQTAENKAPALTVGVTENHNQDQKKLERHNLRCLVVDDDKIILKFVAFILSRLGYSRVDTAQEMPELMNKLTTGPYDILVTDLEMPDMNGFDLSHTIKKRARETKVIIMTGRHRNECLEMMEEGWVDGWLFKPFGVKDVRQKLIGLGLY
jgi:two-component system, chemotaxis family, chemotaxis protein CheY